MSDFVTTPVLGLFKPTYDADDDQWGNHLNENFDILDGVMTPAAADARYLPLTGGTLTGPLEIGTDGSYGAYMILSSPSGTTRAIGGQTNDSPRWVLALGDATPEANVADGNNFALNRYDNSGNFLGPAILVNRATGVVTFGGPASMDLRRLGAARDTVVSGTGTIQGHTANGAVVQGAGSTNDFLLNNKAGAAVMSVPTGTINTALAGNLSLGVAGALAVNQTGNNGLNTGHAAFIQGSGANLGQNGGVLNNVLAVTNGGHAYQGQIASGKNGFFNSILVTNDNIDATNIGGCQALQVGLTLASGAKGGRQTISASLTQVKTANPGASPVQHFYTVGSFGGNATDNDNGTLGAPAGSLFGINPLVILQGAATFWQEITAAEFDVQCNAGSSVNWKTGIKIVLGGSDAVAGTNLDAAMVVSRAVSGVSPGWSIGYAIGAGWWPIAATGTMFGALAPALAGGPAMAAAYGVDLSLVTFSGGAFKSNGFLVDGAGNLVAASLGVGVHKLLGAQIAGWGTPSNGVRGSFDANAATLLLTAQRLAALIADLQTHGLIAA